MTQYSQGLPPLNWLRSFEACARLGSYTAAAKELNITQPAVSHQIRLLEAHLQQNLFMRDGRRKCLTTAGHDYVYFVQEAFDLLRVGTRSVFDPDRGKSLTLRVNMAFTLFWLIPRLDSLYQRHPWIRLNILPHISDTEERPSNFAIEIVNLVTRSQKNYRPLRDEYFFPVCSPALVASGGLDGVPLFESASTTANWETWHGSKHSGPVLRPVNISSTVVISLNAAINGVGMALAHTSLFETASAAGHLVRPYDGQIKMRERYFVNQPWEKEQTAATRAFLEWLDDQLTS
ncbi:LysR family transcriptional regulator [Alphaproteobacteria bacterium US3C007]|jgi:LysR family glycine cleavage system transcriptional activator|nr:LysR family transcriptional regulator [Paracoccaceae bacterium]WQC61456.1 LysR family transcriptional regulator [Alphaproteobacteria bacterium US3C007]|tara:strand:- start:47 stop:916 length:870 start_codon:yes stop_codon:yes gene_type:complete